MKKTVKRPVSRPKKRPVGRPVGWRKAKPIAEFETIPTEPVPTSMTLSMEQFNELMFRSIRGAPKFTRIVDHTDEQLNAAIEVAVRNVPQFWKIMHAVDAYMERRRRQGRPKREQWGEFR